MSNKKNGHLCTDQIDTLKRFLITKVLFVKINKSFMDKKIAIQIADLLNERNQLTVNYNKERVLKSKENYVWYGKENELAACAEVKKVQWYQWEISHVSVAKKYEGKGLGTKILRRAEARARKGNARVIQCTIRSSNESSLKLFGRNGYIRVNQFYYSISKNWVFILQKTVSVE